MLPGFESMIFFEIQEIVSHIEFCEAYLGFGPLYCLTWQEVTTVVVGNTRAVKIVLDL